MAHTSEAKLQAKLEQAKDFIDFSKHYFHYKSPAQHYRIVEVALLEEKEQPAVVYQALYGEKLTWIRDIDDFFSTQIGEDGKDTVKFKPV